MKYAIAQKLSGNASVAVDEMTRVVEENPENAEANLHLGRWLIERGKIEDGAKHLRKAIELQPTYPEAHNQLGIHLLATHDLDGAIRCFKAAIEIEPQYEKAWNNLGVAQMNRVTEITDPQRREEALDDALETFTKMIERWPTYEKAYYNRAVIYANRQQFRQAREELKVALDLNPDYSEAKELQKRLPR